MTSRHDRTKRAYRFFCDAEQDKRIFTLIEVANAAGWSLKTTKAYRSKKWHSFVKPAQGGFVSSGISDLTEDAFIRIHAQRTSLDGNLLRPRFTPEVDVLIDKCREAALLAVQVYNNPLVSFRTPGYIVQMIIAYTALFHAVFERNGAEYWYKNVDGTPKMIDGDNQAWDISECIRQYFKGAMLPEGENLKFFVNIRNKIEHRFVPALDTTLSGKCQSLLMNFESRLIQEFGVYFALGQNLALALQFSVYSPQQEAALRRVQTKEYDAIRQYIDTYDAALPPAIAESQQYCFRAFLIPRVGNHATSSDVAIDFVKYDPDDQEAMEKLQKQIVMVKEKQVQVADQGMHKASDVVRQVRQMTNVPFNLTHHANAWKLYKVRTKSRSAEGCDLRYCQYSVPFKEFIYTDAWITLLCEKVLDPTELERIKTYRSS